MARFIELLLYDSKFVYPTILHNKIEQRMEESEVNMTFNKRLSSSSFSSHPHFQLKSNDKPQVVSTNFERAARINNKNEIACRVSVETVTK